MLCWTNLWCGGEEIVRIITAPDDRDRNANDNNEVANENTSNVQSLRDNLKL